MIETNPLFWLLVFGGSIGMGIVVAIVQLLNPPAPPTPLQAWVIQQDQRCRAMRSRLTYDEKTRTVECFRTPFMRRPRLEFKVTAPL